MTDDNSYIIDDSRSASLCDVGLPDYLITTAIEADGSEHLVLAERSAIGDLAVGYRGQCPDVLHEQLGPLPLDVTRRIVIAARTPRCGRPTKTGPPCRARVAHRGDACGQHRTNADA